MEPFAALHGLGMIVAITKRIRSREGSLRLTLAPATIAKIFNGKITNWTTRRSRS
ncbi:hypothetical protein GCM10014715_23970 [Streptomyces spiralis]|uniref:Uncharacterized protein n=1 Tax=Streptomyces spiralis TaxID=66376 RepID=A0A919DQH1_9ACTN|nr:hypothetical protein [Streptomyces spiralis]GHE69315.1 hypothetical protein GCM10014715_23970 [Streptomyces spiralis]